MLYRRVSLGNKQYQIADKETADHFSHLMTFEPMPGDPEWFVRTDLLTVGDIVETAMPGETFDYSIPQAVFDRIGPGYIWHYPKTGPDRIMGRAVKVSDLKRLLLHKIAVANANGDYSETDLSKGWGSNEMAV